MYNLIKNKKLVKERIEHLRNAIASSRVYRPRNLAKLVFLCGANNNNSISERRKALIEFAKTHLPHTQFFIAEKMFSILLEEGHKGNILDIENDISEFADHILIVLESNSSFAELGAFSHKKLRSNLIVINDSQYESSNSFINLGPLKAILESSGKNSIIHYKMSKDGIHRKDAIGDVFKPLHDLLKEPLRSHASAIDLNTCNPATNYDKFSAMFVHDLIYFSGPVNHKELVEILIQIFGNQRFKLKEHVAILAAFESIERDSAGLFRSKLGKTYYEYRFDTNKLISTFRNYTLKFYPERFYGN
ncbi:MAG TPA: retron St85 family effector protein [Sideroxyarcus sp.]|nr:retron St85 family effector protein [Sideroxyarcus sp.]